VQQLGATSEDCLSVNVFTERLDGPPRPVMVWIHGGANRFGSGKDEAAALVPYGVVVVTLNYRLGLLGFLAHPALRRESPHASSGNYALLDQIEALRWVQRNVAAFGGDPRRVTLFGHSAGGDSIAQLLASPLARGLFHRAIIHSGGLGTSRPRTEMEAEGVAIATRLGAPPDDPLPSLRALPSERLIAAGDGPFDASADGWLLPVAGPGALAPDADPALPLLVGATSDEANVFALRGDLETYRALVDESPAPWRIRVAALYPATNDREASAAIAPFMTARDFVCPARYVAARRRGPTWLYRFALPPRPGPGGRSLGAFHGTDVHLLFDRTYGLPRTEAATKLGDAMRHAWARFAATGDPDAPGFPAWRPYDRENPRQIVLDAAIDAADARDTRCDVFDAMWDSLYAGG
jgi:para-nitrobenzyl esterase